MCVCVCVCVGARARARAETLRCTAAPHRAVVQTSGCFNSSHTGTAHLRDDFESVCLQQTRSSEAVPITANFYSIRAMVKA